MTWWLELTLSIQIISCLLDAHSFLLLIIVFYIDDILMMNVWKSRWFSINNAIHPLFQGGERPKKTPHDKSIHESESSDPMSHVMIRSDPIPGFRVQRGAKSSKSSRPVSAEKKRPATLLEVAAVAMFDRRLIGMFGGRYNILHGAVALEVYNFWMKWTAYCRRCLVCMIIGWTRPQSFQMSFNNGSTLLSLSKRCYVQMGFAKPRSLWSHKSTCFQDDGPWAVISVP